MTRIDSLAGLPIEQFTSPNTGGRMTAVRGLVLHMAQGTYDGTIAWQKNAHQRDGAGHDVTTSSTFIVGKERGQWAQGVPIGVVAWCQRAGSLDWLSVELEGFVPDAPTGWQVEACAQLLALLHVEYGVPLQVARDPGEYGLGHHSMDREWIGEEWGHEACPGVGVIAAKTVIVDRARAIVSEGENVDPAAVWQVEFQGYVPNDDGKFPAVNTKHALFSAQRDAHFARQAAQATYLEVRKPTVVTLSDEQLDGLADRVAQRLGSLRFEPTTHTESNSASIEGDVLPPA